MKKLTALLLASSLVAALPAAAFAQAAPDPAAPAAPSVEAGADAGAAFDWSKLLETLNTPPEGDPGAIVASISEGSMVEIVNVFSLEGAPAQADGMSELQAAASTSGESLQDLREAINGNAHLMSLLTAQQHTADDVVAITSDASGGFIVYVQIEDAAGAGAAAPAPATAAPAPVEPAPGAPAPAPGAGAGY
jgi:hypothetical protein